MRIPIEPEVYDLIFTEDERTDCGPSIPTERVQNRRGIYLLQQAQRAPAAALRVRSARRDYVLSGAAGIHARVAGPFLVQFELYAGAFRTTFAERGSRESCGDNRACAIDTAWRLALARAPRKEEMQLARRFLASPAGALPDFCLALLNRNEFLYVP